MITKEYLDKLSKSFQNVEFICFDFREAINNVKTGDFVYLDPPYAPVNDSSFVGYNKDGFNLQDHKDLFKLINNFNNKKIKFIMSNAEVKLVTDSFKDYKKDVIEVRRRCNAKNPESRAKEVIIHN